ncbi:MAG: hypothetical protein PHI63_00935 [Patescibacteria group bacterium]|nr:hypothetical protein [Patescibacteria group bacterium]
MPKRNDKVSDPFDGVSRSGLGLPTRYSSVWLIVVGGLVVVGAIGAVWFLPQLHRAVGPAPAPFALPSATVAPAVSPAAAVPATSPVAAPTPSSQAAATFNEFGRTFREYGREYSDAGDLFFGGYANVGGTLAYTARQGNQLFVVHRGGMIGQDLPDLGGILEILDNGGKPAFLALRSDLSPLGGFGSYIFFDGQRIGASYAYVRDPASISGKLAYVGIIKDSTRPGGQRSVVVYDGKEYGRAYDEVETPFALEGKLAFFATRGADFMVVTVYDGKESILPESQFDVPAVKDAAGRVVFVYDNGTARDQAVFNGKAVTVDMGTDRSYAWYDGQKLGAEYDEVLEVAPVGGKLALLVQKKGRTLIAYDGKEYGHHYDSVYDLPGEKSDAYSLRMPYRMGKPQAMFSAIKFVGDVGGKLTYLVTVGFSADGSPKQIIVQEE